MDPGEMRPFVQRYAEHLAALGHTPLTVTNYTYNARHFTMWLCQSGLGLADIGDGAIDRFAQHLCRCPGGRSHDHLSDKYVRYVRLFVRFLVEIGAVPASPPKPARIVEPRIIEFADWQRRHRGLCEKTIAYQSWILERHLPGLGADVEAYSADLIRKLVIDVSGSHSHSYIRQLSVALRQYLSFLESRGDCRPGLEQAIPAIAEWRLAALPRYLPVTAVERLIDSCDRGSPGGTRDRAILLLLARLGLRAGDIVGMGLNDVEWTDGTLRVCGKGRREIRLPLPQDAGDAVLDYLTKVRPSVSSDRLFLRVWAPHTPFKGPASVSKVVQFALARAGITDAPTQGANLLRHSAATAMLRAGASLDAVGSVLRHRSLETTAHYAKVDLPMLRRIAQPWPGGAPC